MKKKPKFMFLENVKHIKKIDNGNTFSYIIKELMKLDIMLIMKILFLN